MTDVHTPAQRRRNMQRIRAKDTKPEWLVRRFLFGRGIRYRLHDKSLPGTPDLVLPRYRTVLFVHGCFWKYG
jgi:DNA mismatch endonuclease (patch repair protein)